MLNNSSSLLYAPLISQLQSPSDFFFDLSDFIIIMIIIIIIDICIINA